MPKLLTLLCPFNSKVKELCLDKNSAGQKFLTSHTDISSW